MKNLNLFMCCAFAVMSCSSDFPTYNDIKKQPEPVQAKAVNEFLNSMGVCAGIDGRGETVEPSASDNMGSAARFNYVGVRWMRAGTEGSFRSDPEELAASRKKLMDSMYRFHELTGAKFSFGIGSGASGGKAEVEFMLGCANELAQRGLLLALEGANEPNNFPLGGGSDNGYDGVPGGGSKSWLGVAYQQRDIYELSRSSKYPYLNNIPVWSVSTIGAVNDNVGLQYLTIPEGANTMMPDGTRYATHMNCHNYAFQNEGEWAKPNDNQTWKHSDPTSNNPGDGPYVNFGVTWNKNFKGYTNEELAELPRVVTETGLKVFGNFSEEMHASFLMNIYLCQFKRGWSNTAIYILRDRVDEDPINITYGMFRGDNTKRPAADCIRNITTILADDVQATTNPGILTYAIPNQPSVVHDLLLQKSNGKYYLIVWGEKYSGGKVNATVQFDKKMKKVNIYNPRVSAEVKQTLENTDAITMTYTTNPYIFEIEP